MKNPAVVIADFVKLCYTFSVTAPRLVKKGCACMEVFVTFFVAVAAGVACHYIIKWLDGDKYPVTSLWL